MDYCCVLSHSCLNGQLHELAHLVLINSHFLVGLHKDELDSIRQEYYIWQCERHNSNRSQRLCIPAFVLSKSWNRGLQHVKKAKLKIQNPEQGPLFIFRARNLNFYLRDLCEYIARHSRCKTSSGYAHNHNSDDNWFRRSCWEGCATLNISGLVT